MCSGSSHGSYQVAYAGSWSGSQFCRATVLIVRRATSRAVQSSTRRRNSAAYASRVASR